MTIIVWDGTTLAADRFATTRGPKDERFKRAVVNKVFVPKNVTLATDEPTTAYAMTGPVDQIRQVCQYIDGQDEGTDIVKGVKTLMQCQIATVHVTVAIFGIDWLHVITVDNYRAHHKDGDNSFVAIGGGGTMAAQFHRVAPNLTAQEYIFLVSALQRGYGGGISTVKAGETIRLQKDLPKKQKEKLARILHDYIVNHHIPHIEGPGDITGTYVD